MKTPFTQEQFFQVFEKYNHAVFPLQLALFGFGILVVLLIHRDLKNKSLWIGGFLALLWLWTGIAYHLSFFTPINRAAYGFGGIFILQGIFFLIETFRGRLQFSQKNHTWQYIGYFFVLFGLIIYPLISYALSEFAAQTISLGLPCPTTIFTLGWLMFTSRQFPKYLLIIPILWALIGTGAAINFGVYQDYVMLIAAAATAIYLFPRKKKETATSV